MDVLSIFVIYVVSCKEIIPLKFRNIYKWWNPYKFLEIIFKFHGPVCFHVLGHKTCNFMI